MPDTFLSSPAGEKVGALQAIPTTTTVLPGTTTTQQVTVYTMTIFNTTAASINLTLADTSGTPVKALNAAPIAASPGTLVITDTNGLVFNGLTWLASATGLTATYKVGLSGV